MPDDVGILAAHHGKQGIRIDRDGGADASAADVDLVKAAALSCTMVGNCFSCPEESSRRGH